MIPVVIRGTTQRNRRESAVSEPVKLPRQPWREVSRKAREPSQTTFSPRWGSFTNSNGQVHGSWARYHHPHGATSRSRATSAPPDRSFREIFWKGRGRRKGILIIVVSSSNIWWMARKEGSGDGPLERNGLFLRYILFLLGILEWRINNCFIFEYLCTRNISFLLGMSLRMED